MNNGSLSQLLTFIWTFFGQIKPLAIRFMTFDYKNIISRLRDSVQWANVYFRANFWDLENFWKSQMEMKVNQELNITLKLAKIYENSSYGMYWKK